MNSITITTKIKKPKEWKTNEKIKSKSLLHKKRNYSPLRVLFYAHIEKKHRIVFDCLYQQNYKIRLKDEPLLIYYRILCMIAPEFRPYLRYWKTVVNRAYNQKRVNCINFYIFYIFKKINAERYSPYSD
jgi:hypothetical protein